MPKSPLDEQSKLHFEEAQKRIANVRVREGHTLSLQDLTFLKVVPDEIAKLTSILSLQLPAFKVEDLTKIKSLHQLRYLSAYGVDNLDGIEALQNLTTLRIGSLTLSNVAPLQSLKNLASLDIWCGTNASLAPLQSLSGLVQLSVIGSDGGFEPIGAIESLRLLKVLHCPKFEDINFVKSLINLEHLIIGEGNSIRNYSPLSSLSRLSTLDVFIESADDILWLGQIAMVKHLYLRSRSTLNLAPLSKLRQLQTLELQGRIADLEPLRTLTNLVNLDISDTNVYDLSPLSNLVGLVVGADRDRVSGGLGYSSKTIADPVIREIGNVGRVQRTRRVLQHLRDKQGLSPLDSAVSAWLQTPSTDRFFWRSVISNAKPSDLGIRFVEGYERLEIASISDPTDELAALDAVTQQLHEGVKRRAIAFVPIAMRLDNQPMWQGIGAVAKRLADAADSDTLTIPTLIGRLYESVVELGSYLDLDHRLHAMPNASDSPLEPEIHRALADLIRTAAPWVRRFPTARKLDDESGAFLTKSELYSSATAATDHARRSALISEDDAETLHLLLEAAERGEFQGQKAGTRGAASTRNLVLAAGSLVATFYVGSISSDYATKSKLVMRAGTFLQQAEVEVTQLFADAPADIRLALMRLLDDLRQANQHGTTLDRIVWQSSTTRQDDDED